MAPERKAAIQAATVRLADGDRSAMPELVAELWPVLRDFAKRGLRDRHDAEDVAQEVLLRICSRISEFDRSRDALSWAFGIASFEILTQRRRQARRREAFSRSGTPEVSGAAASVEDEALRAELRVVLTQALGELATDDLAQLGLEGEKPAGAATPAMRKRRQRAVERLRLVWRRIYGEP